MGSTAGATVAEIKGSDATLFTLSTVPSINPRGIPVSRPVVTIVSSGAMGACYGISVIDTISPFSPSATPFDSG